MITAAGQRRTYTRLSPLPLMADPQQNRLPGNHIAFEQLWKQQPLILCPLLFIRTQIGGLTACLLTRYGVNFKIMKHIL